jgi:hypothetical protein
MLTSKPNHTIMISSRQKGNTMFNKSLDSILGTFTKVQSDLAAFIERTTIESDRKMEQVRILQVEVAAKNDEVARASAVMEKIEALIK